MFFTLLEHRGKGDLGDDEVILYHIRKEVLTEWRNYATCPLGGEMQEKNKKI